MKHIKKLMMLAMVLALVLTCMVPAVMAAGETGIITLTNAAIGMKYQAYKILDATYDGDKIAYTTTKNVELFSEADSPWVVQQTPDANGNYAVQLAEGKTVENVNTWIENNLSSFTAIAPSTGADSDNKATASTVTWTGLAYGYYYITSGLGSTVTINSVAPEAEVIDKNVTGPENLAKESDSATAQIGDEVKFTVTFTATNFVTAADSNPVTTEKITKYSFFDTAAGFDFLVDDDHPVMVKIGDREAAKTTVSVENGTMTFDIAWVNQNGELLYNYSEDVTVTYYGIVNADAQDGDAVNTVAVKYNDDTAVTGQNLSTTTNTYSLTINKTDGTNALKGAKFKLHRGEAAATAMKLISITVDNAAADTVYYRVAEADEEGVEVIDMSKASSAVIYGLDGADTYYIEEIEAPKGYNMLTAAQAQAMGNTNVAVAIVNVAGVLLPSTGGMGTTIFYVLGGLMVVGALVILVTNKRMRSR